VIVQMTFLKSGQPIVGLTAKDFVVKVDKQGRAIESVQYVVPEGKPPYYLLAFKPIESERGTGPHAAQIIVTIGKNEVKANYKFSVPRRGSAPQTPSAARGLTVGRSRDTRASSLLRSLLNGRSMQRNDT